MNEISKHITYDTATSPTVILLVGTSRSGTTVFARLFAELGITTWYQPLKAILRNLNAGKDARLTLTGDYVFIKETLGAYTTEEATLNAVEILLDAGVPKDKLRVITLCRDPLPNAVSTVRHFSFFEQKEDLIDILITSFNNLRTIRTTANENDVPLLSFVYEAWKHDPKALVKRMAEVFGFPIDENKMDNWSKVETLKEVKNINWIEEPNGYYAHDFFEKVKATPTISYYDDCDNREMIELSEEQRQKIYGSNIGQIYAELFAECKKDFSL